MPITVTCAGCAARYAVKDQLEGKLIRCPKCKADMVVARSSKRPRKDEPEFETAIAAPPNREPDLPAETAEEPPVPPQAERARVRPLKINKSAGMPRWLKISLGVVGGFFALSCVSCLAFTIWAERAKKKALVYNQTLTDAQDRVAKRRIELEESLDRHRLGRAPGADGMASLRGQHDELRKTIDAVRGEMASWPTFWSAGSLHSGYQRYLDNAKAELPALAKAIDVVGDDRLADEDRQNQVAVILNDLDAIEKTKFRELENLQREFASSHCIMLLPRPPPQPRFIMTPEMRRLLEQNKKR